MGQNVCTLKHEKYKVEMYIEKMLSIKLKTLQNSTNKQYKTNKHFEKNAVVDNYLTS